MGSTNYSLHLLDFFWALLSRSFLSVRHLMLIYELLKVACPYEPFNLIFYGHIPISVMSYILVEGEVSPYIPSGFIAFHGFLRSVQA